MKLQKEELAAVANHIYEKIKEKNRVVATKEELRLIESFLKKKDSISDEINKLQNESSKLHKDTFNKLGIGTSFYYTSSPDRRAETLKMELERLKTKKTPHLNDIRQEIIMKSLFSNETELKKFIEELIAKY